MILAEIQLRIGLVNGVNIQDILPCGFNPFGSYGDKLEYESLNSAGRLQSEVRDLESGEVVFVEVIDERSQQEEGCVLCYEKLREVAPFESVVHFIENSLLASSKVIEHTISLTEKEWLLVNMHR